MLKKILVMSLTVIVLTIASGGNAFAQTIKTDENRSVAKLEKLSEAGDLKAVVKAKSKSEEINVSNKSTLAEYERAKKQGKGLSTTTKVLIGVGIAAAVLAVIFVAARDDLKDNILQ